MSRPQRSIQKASYRRGTTTSRPSASLQIVRQRKAVIEPVREDCRLEGLRLVAGDNILRPRGFSIAALYRHHIDVAVDREIALNGGKIDVVEGAWRLGRLQWHDLDASWILDD